MSLLDLLCLLADLVAIILDCIFPERRE